MVLDDTQKKPGIPGGRSHLRNPRFSIVRLRSFNKAKDFVIAAQISPFLRRCIGEEDWIGLFDNDSTGVVG